MRENASRTDLLTSGLTVVLCFGFLGDGQALVAQTKPLTRSYRVGEPIRYTMQGINEGHLRTIHYEAVAKGQVTRDASGNFVEEFAWTRLSVNGHAVPLSSGSQQFREDLSLAPGFTLGIPDMSKVQPMLIGPITDLLTFYADVQLAMRQGKMARPGDHVYFRHGPPNSWADGTYTAFGQDSVDFDITFAADDEKKDVATLIIRHVPPAKPQIAFPAAWMPTALTGLTANWAEVDKGDGGRYLAEVGQETFDVTVDIALSSGRILYAKLDNPVDVLERDCDDAALSSCGVPIRYRIRRQVNISADPATDMK
jgi:hypothetical protein